MRPSTSSQNLDWVRLVAPWAGIVATAVVAAFVYSTQELTHGDDDAGNPMRLLFEDQPSHVYNEEHPSLFPLTQNDFVGFFLAILGLMVAVRDNGSAAR